MRPTHHLKITLILSLSALLLIASASSRGQSGVQSILVSVITDVAPGPAARHGLNTLIAALKAKGVTVEQTDSLETAHGTMLLVAGRAAGAGAAVALLKSLGI